MPDTHGYDARARLRLHGRLGGVRPSGFHVLKSPSGDALINPTAAAIFKLCDGTRTRQQIIVHLARARPDPEFAEFVLEFLDAAVRSAWVSELKSSHIDRAESREKIPTS
jgi:hypothetical protein